MTNQERARSCTASVGMWSEPWVRTPPMLRCLGVLGNPKSDEVNVKVGTLSLCCRLAKKVKGTCEEYVKGLRVVFDKEGSITVMGADI